MDTKVERMSDDEFKPLLLKAIHDELETGGGYVHSLFVSIPRSRYPESVWSEYKSDGTFGATWRRIIIKLFPEMGELVCDRMRIF